MAEDYYINPDDPRSISNVVAVVRGLATKKRPQRVTIKEQRDNRSNPQNALYHVAIVQPFAEYLFEQGYGKEFGDLKVYAHETLKKELLTVAVCNPDTGEVLTRADGSVVERVRSTTELTVPEFCQFIEDCAMWLAKNCDLPVQLPGDVEMQTKGKVTHATR